MYKEVSSYSGGSKFFHWLIAVIVILMVTGSFFLDTLPEQYISTAFMYHKSMGITILFLMIMRLIWLAYTGKPPLPATVPAWQRIAAHFVQYALYFFVILMPLCGWIMSVAADKAPYYFGLFQLSLPGIEPNKALSSLMKQAHNTIAWIIIMLIALHIAGALKHRFIDKDRVFQRMWFGKSAE